MNSTTSHHNVPTIQGAFWYAAPMVQFNPSYQNAQTQQFGSNHSKPQPPQQQQFPSCNFCRKNGEDPADYAHQLKDRTTGRLLCPVLRSLVCDICGATEDQAHTRSYCPQRPPGTVNMSVLYHGTNNSVGFRRDRRHWNRY